MLSAAAAASRAVGFRPTKTVVVSSQQLLSDLTGSKPANFGRQIQARFKHTLSSTSTAMDKKELVSEKETIYPALHSKSKRVRPFKDIPGPRGLPVIGTMWDYVKKDGLRVDKMFEVIKERSDVYGPIYREKIGHMQSVVISDPEEYAKVIYVDGKYPNRTEMEPLAHYHRKRGMGLGLFNGQGEEWYRQRVILSKKTLRPFDVLKYVGPMDETASDFVRHLNQRRSDTGIVPDLEHEIFKWALESFGTFLFEERIGCLNDPQPKQAQEFIDSVTGLCKYFTPLMYGVPIYKIYPTKTWKVYEGYKDRAFQIGQTFVVKKLAVLERQTKEGLAEEQKEEKSEFLTYLLSQTNLTPEEVNVNCMDLLNGAVETVATSVLWALYCLSRCSSAQDALYQETAYLLKGDEKITSEKLQNMQYVRACLKETFRLYPIAFATSRRISQDIEVCGYHIPAGTHCQANLYGMGRDPKLFTDPTKFKPDRWLRENYEGPIQALTNLPFGHGSRMCIGRRLAEQELYIVLSRIIQNFKVEYDGEEDVQPVLHTIMVPDRPLKLIFSPRV